MIRLFKHYVPNAVLLLGFLDILLLAMSGELGWMLRAHQLGIGLPLMQERWPQLVSYALFLEVAMVAVGVYGADSLQSLRYAMARLIVAISLGVIGLSVLYFLIPEIGFWRSNLLYAMGCSIASLIALRILLGKALGSQAFKRRIVVLGAGARAQRLKDLSKTPGAGFVVVGYVAMSEANRVIPEAIARDAIYNLADHVVVLNASEVVLALEERRNALPLKDLLRIKTTGVHVNEISTFLERETGRVDLDSVNPSWLIFSDGFSSGRMLSSLFKRLFDIGASLVLLMLMLPIILLTAILVKLESRGPAFYRQRRVGLYGTGFDVIKLRSMRQDAEVDGKAVWAEKDDPRITRVGRVIRKTRIDELPQCWSVLKGEMSFVGPRPERPQFVEDLEAKLPYYAERHMVKPGITGWAQINYPYGASIEDSRQKLEYDLYYAKNYSPFLDVLILLQTIRVVLFPEGARQMGALLLWLHALAALLFGALALWAWRTDLAGLPRRPLAFALAATAFWALAIAGIGSTDFASWFAETLRNLAWLGFMLVLHRRDAQTRPPIALGTVYGVVALVQIGALALTLIAYADPEPIVAAQTANAAVLLRMLVAVAALVLVQALWSALSPAAGGPLRTLVLALAGIWCAELGLYTIAYLAAEWRIEPLVLRGLAYLAVALAIGAVLQRKGEWKIEVSRAVTYQSLSLVAVGVYFALLALATSAIATVGGPNARILQTAFVLGSTAAILTLVANSWLRAWLKVKLAKHLFRHRYDYRTEWMRFTETLGNPQGGAALDERIVKAIADLTESPAGVLLVPDAGGLGVGASWNWDRATLPIASDTALGGHLQASGRIIELDAVRRSEDHLDAAVVPQWMLDLPEAWVIVPLPHLAELAGAILLARPPLDRALDWEDFDLLKVAGRQVASYLAEARAQDALAEAQRFDEFNRRFAFILHDIKNLVSQLTLTARNAERHADKPEFRADMVATLQSSAERMNGLLARLSQHHRGRSEAPHAIEIVALVERVATQRRGQHPVVTSGVRSAIAHADPASLEQLLGHLVQNAIDASPANEPVTLAVSADGERVAIDVIDLGIGMSPGFIRDKLFKPFVSSKEGGFGIGVFEARQLAHAMEGRIEVTSREGKGTRFRVILKAAHPADLGMGRAA